MMRTDIRKLGRKGLASCVALAIAATALAALARPAHAEEASDPSGNGAGGDAGRCSALSTTPAQHATTSASYTAGWNRVAAVSDGTTTFTGGSQDQLWGTWSNNRPAQQWLQYDWAGEGTLTGAAVSFWRDNSSDTAGSGVAVPRAWRLQSWTDGTWQDIALADGAAYPREKDAPNTVVFVQPVTTSKLRAVFDATTDGTTYAAVGVSEFAVSGDVVPKDGVGTETLVSDAFNVAISRNTGGVYQLGNASDVPTCTNYVMNPTSRPAFDVNDSRWVGDVTMKVDGAARITGLSDDIRTVSRTADGVQVAYDGEAANTNGIRGFSLTEDYALTGSSGDVLDWSFTIENTSSGQMEVEDLAIPMLMNSWWNGGDQTGIYEQNVARHSFVAEDGSYAYWQRPNGEGPYLVMVPESGTSLEFRDKARIGEGPFAENDPAWEGLVEFAVHSKALQPARAGKVEGYLPATSLTLEPGQSQTYGFTFRWANDYSDLRNVLYDAGVVDVVSLPGMVIPEDQRATLAVRAKDGIDSVVGEDGKDVTVSPLGDRNGYSLYELDFGQLGASQVTVTYGGDRKSVLQYYSTNSVGELIDSHADFLVDNQQAKTTRGYDGAFLQWDMSTQKQITWDDYPGGGWKQWMAGGSDDQGLSPALYLAEKNLIAPDQDQVAAIDYYIDNFLLGYLQSRTENGERTWQIYRWYDGNDETPNDQGIWRAYNYTHVANTYYTMYRVKTAYPALTTSFTAKEYLEMAYHTLDAMFHKIPLPTPIGDAAHTLGLMGEGTYPELLDALRDEGLATEADELNSLVEAKSSILFAEEYPFASEASIDTTGFEANYTMAKMFDNPEMVEKVQNASMAARGLQPLWYYYGSDNRHMGESWWNLGYETHLGAWQQQDYLLNYADPDSPDFDEVLRSTYGAYLGGWANINAGQISSASANIGAASWQYQSQKGAGEGSDSYWGFMPMLDGWWAWSGEADLGFWGGLRTASVNVVDDGVVGLYAYGGEVDRTDGVYTITPSDGVRQRFTLFTENRFGVSVEGATYTSAKVSDDLTDTTLSLENSVAGPSSATISLTNVPDGDYQVSVDGTATSSRVSAVDGRAVVELELSGASHQVRVWQEGQAHSVAIGDSAHGTASASVGEAVAGDTVTLSATPDEGYELSGWQTEPDAVQVGEDGTFVMPDGPVTVTAEFAPVAYRINYDLAGGAGAEQNPDNYTVESDEITLTAPTRDGYTFAGWSGTGIEGVEGAVTIPAGSIGDRSYTANWRSAVPEWSAATPYATAGTAVSYQGKVYVNAWYTKGEEPGSTATGAWQEKGVPTTTDHGTLDTWTASWSYRAGDTVAHDGKAYRAAWYSRNEKPGSTATGAWQEIGAPVTTDTGTVNAWTSSWIYRGGETVAHNGHLFEAKRYTRNQEPTAAANGPWQDLGQY